MKKIINSLSIVMILFAMLLMVDTGLSASTTDLGNKVQSSDGCYICDMIDTCKPAAGSQIGMTECSGGGDGCSGSGYFCSKVLE